METYLLRQPRYNHGMFENWLENALKHGEIKQAELARQLHQRFGWADDRSVINKILKGRRDISAKEMFEISQITGYPLPAKSGEASISGGLDEIKKSVDMVLVRGKVAANTWMDVDDMDFSYDDMESVPSLSGYPPSWQFGLKVDGNCLNKIASHGDVLVCLDIISAQVDIVENDLAIVERRRFDGQMVQRTAKRVRRSAKGFELWPESTDPSHQDPILLYETILGEDVSIIGKVLWILRKP